MTKNGYIIITAPADWPGKKISGNYCFEHHYVVWKSTGLLPKRGYCIHHKNKNKLDNRPENLERMTIQEHFAIHRHHKWKVCPVCKKAFNARAGQVCCSRACSNKKRSKRYVNGHNGSMKK